jgi:hypothetical protein
MMSNEITQDGPTLQVKQTDDPELERLLAEEEAIEARNRNWPVEVANLNRRIDELERELLYKQTVNDNLREQIVVMSEERQAELRSVDGYKQWLAMHVLNYPAGCIDGKREFLDSCGIDWPVTKYTFEFVIPLGPDQRNNFYAFAQGFMNHSYDYLEAQGINRNYIHSDYNCTDED